MDLPLPLARAFSAEVSRQDAHIDLAKAALVMARLRYPDLNVDRELLRLDALADQVRISLGHERLTPAAVARVLFMEMGFRGNGANYTEDANSYLNDVLDRKLGIPISLAVLHIEVARRLGVTVEPVGFPAHFLTSGFENGERVFFDCFNGGALLRERDCMRLLTQVAGGAQAFSPGMLAPVDKRSVLLRMLNNLKGIYLQGKLWSMLAQVIELVLVLNPSDVSEQRNFGVALVNAGQYRRGLDVISRWLEHNPDSPDAKSMRTYAMELAERVARWN